MAKNKKMKTLWFDLRNTPHVNFLKPIIKHYCANNKIILSARDFSETVELARSQLNMDPIVMGKYGGKNKAKKLFMILLRLLIMNFKIPSFDIVLACGGVEASIISRIRRKKIITFDDNDISPNWMYSHFVDYAFFPKAISRELLLKQGFKSSCIIQYNGYKEDIYISDYEADEEFCKSLPFNEYVVVRPENLMANYMKKACRSIVPELLRLLSKKKYNVLYFPRYSSDKLYAQGFKEIYIPPSPVNGLDACYFSQAVLSGAGSFTREAACLGKPSVSFYAGDTLLAVDRQMINDGWIFHSRNPEEIIRYIENTSHRNVNIERSRAVKSKVFTKLSEIMEI